MPKRKNSEWKKSERRMAELLSIRGALETARVPIPGRQRGETPDIAHPWFAIEHKYGKRVLSGVQNEAWEQAEASADEQGLPPLVTLEQRRGPGRPLERFVMMRAEQFVELLETVLHSRGTAVLDVPPLDR